VIIKIRAKKPHAESCDWRCPLCKNEEDRVKGRAWEILMETGLDKELHTYYDDMGEERTECIIEVELV